MVHRYFRTKREAERAAEKLKRDPCVSSECVQVNRAGFGGYEVFCLAIVQAVFDDILSRPMKRKEGKE